jgi:hypothetical protein
MYANLSGVRWDGLGWRGKGPVGLWRVGFLLILNLERLMFCGLSWFSLSRTVTALLVPVSVFS